MLRGTSLRGVSGVVAALILLLMFVGTILIYATFIRAQQEIYKVQMQAAKLAEKLRAATRALILYYNATNTTDGVALNIIIENRGDAPVTIANLILEYGYGEKPFDMVVIGNQTDSDAPSFDKLAEYIYRTAGVYPEVNITLYIAGDGNETLPSLPATVGPGDRLVVTIAPLPLDFKVYSVLAEASFSLPGGGLLAALVTPQVTGGVVIVQQTMPASLAGAGGGLQPPPFDTVTWVYGVPLRINCTYERYNWPTIVVVNFTELGIGYLVDPNGVRLLDLDGNVYVPVNVTRIAPNYMAIVFPLTCKAGQLRNLTILAAGGPLYHPEGFYEVGLARLWNGSIVLEHGVNIYSTSTGPIYYLLEAPIGTLEPIDEATLASYETDISKNVDDYQTLAASIPYYSTSLTKLYYHSDVRLNTTSSNLYAAPSTEGLAQGSAAIAPAWLAGWKYYIEIQVSNPLGVTLENVLVNISTNAFISSLVVNHLFSHARSDGGDIVFVDLETGQPLPFLTVKWDPVSQEAEWLVKIPSLGPWQSMRIGLFYGNPAYTGALKTLVSDPSNINYIYSFISSIQPPSIRGYEWNYTVFALPVSSWSRVLAATDFDSPNATVWYPTGSFTPTTTTLPAGHTFPFFGVTYDTGSWHFSGRGFAYYDDNVYTATDVSWITSLGGVDEIQWDLYIRSGYTSPIGTGLLVRLNATLYVWRGFFFPRLAAVGSINAAFILYENGVVEYVYDDISSSVTPPSAQSDVMNDTDPATAPTPEILVVYYPSGDVTGLAYHDVVFVPYAPLAKIYWWHPATSIHYASLSATSVNLARHAGGGFEVFHWKSSNGIYGSNIDVITWIAWDGDILVTPYSLPRYVLGGSYQVNYTAGFAPGVAGDPGIVLYSDADNFAGVYNWSTQTTVILPAKEVLLLNYRAYQVNISAATPLYPWVVGWEHGLRVVIHNPNSFSLTNYTLRVTLGADNLTRDYIESPLFGRDIRVLDAKGNRIPFWVEYRDVSVPVIVLWVKVPYIPASGNATIYIYYDANPPQGTTVRDESNPWRTMIAYLEVTPGECPQWEAYNTTGYECVAVIEGGFPSYTLVQANMTPGDIVRFYNTTIFGVSGVYGYEYYFRLVPRSTDLDYDVVVEIVPSDSVTTASVSSSYGVVFGGGVLGRLVGGALDATWDGGSVQYTVGSTYDVYIYLNGTHMVTLVYNESGLVASAVDLVAANGYYRAAVTSYSQSAIGTAAYEPVRAWVRTWVYREPYVASSLLLA